jgi:hypothetical protein
VGDPSGFGQGEHFLESAIVTTDGNGQARFVIPLAEAVAPGTIVTATATDTANNTSAFSRGILVQIVPPTVHCFVAQTLLWPPNSKMVSVGLSVLVTPPQATLQLWVYGNDHAVPADAADIGPETLRLRAHRRLLGTGRVYLIVAQVADAAGSAFDVCTVVVPRNCGKRAATRP